MKLLCICAKHISQEFADIMMKYNDSEKLISNYLNLLQQNSVNSWAENEEKHVHSMKIINNALTVCKQYQAASISSHEHSRHKKVIWNDQLYI